MKKIIYVGKSKDLLNALKKNMLKEEIDNMTLEEIKAIPYFREKDAKINGIVIIPRNEIHDSGYECMEFVLLNHGKIVGKLDTWSDVIHLDVFNILKSSRFGLWKIDCLPKSHLLRLFNHEGIEIEDWCVSDFYINTKEGTEKYE